MLKLLIQVLVLMSRTIINHWRYEDGKRHPHSGPPSIVGGIMEPAPAGWYCWVYPENDREFEQWMYNYCPTAECTHRFNSGDPMYTVYIKDSQEATMFALKWGVN